MNEEEYKITIEKLEKENNRLMIQNMSHYQDIIRLQHELDWYKGLTYEPEPINAPFYNNTKNYREMKCPRCDFWIKYV